VAGPLGDVGPGKRYAHVGDILREYSFYNTEGREYQLWSKYQELYGRHGETSNLVVPVFMPTWQKKAEITNLVVLSHPDDAARIARTHPQKAPNFEPIFADSLISTTDNSHWLKQRAHFVQAFMPTTTLDKIFPISLERAQQAADKLEGFCAGGSTAININEFLLHEANAQVQTYFFRICVTD
jgi:cytochrome P450